MNAVILDQQSDLFEVSVLEQSVEVSLALINELINANIGSSCIIIGKKGIANYQRLIRSIYPAFYRQGKALILVTPPPGIDIGGCIEAPSSIYITKRQPSSHCRVIDKHLAAAIENDLEIRTDGFIDTSLSAGTLCTDEQGRAILLRYQPKNTTGAVFITTAWISSYTAMTNEVHREMLLKEIISWRNDYAMVSGNDTKIDEPDGVDSQIIPVVSVVLLAVEKVDEVKIIDISNKFFDVALDTQMLSRALDYLCREQVIFKEKTGYRIKLSRLEEIVANMGLHAYVREIRELNTG